MEDTLKFAQLAMMLSSDRPQGSLDVIQVPGLTAGMLGASGILSFAAQQYHEGVAPRISFNGSNGRAFGSDVPRSAWPGSDDYIAELESLGVPRENLVPIGEGLFTLQEVQELVAEAVKRQWKRVGIITSPFYFLRVFCYIAKLVQGLEFVPHFFALCPPSTDWQYAMTGSQGLSSATPATMAQEELPKTLEHIARGLAASPDEVIEYLLSRGG